MKKQHYSIHSLWPAWALGSIGTLWCSEQNWLKAAVLFCICLIVSCKQEDESEKTVKSINAIALSRNSSILVDRTTYWWHQMDNNSGNTAMADTIKLTANIFYGASLAFYHIENEDTINLTGEVTALSNMHLVLWTPSDTAALGIEFKGSDIKRSVAYLYPSGQHGIHALSLKLLYHADLSNPANPGGDSIIACTFPLVIE